MKSFWLLIFLAAAIESFAQTNLPLPAANLPVGEPVSAISTNPPARIRPLADVTIFSDAWQGDLKSNVFVYRGNVVLNDAPQMKLFCETFTVESPKLVSNKFTRATAEGNVIIDFLAQGMTNHATADRVVYTQSVTNGATNAVVELIALPSSSVVITNPESVIEGNPLIWNRTTELISGEHLRMTHTMRTNSPDFFGPIGQSKTNSPK